MSQIIYVVQSFSRGPDGALVWDAPAWSQDQAFAASLSQALARRKAGVMTIGVACDAAGDLAPEAQILSGYGAVPTSLIVPSLQSQSASSPAVDRRPAVIPAGAQRRAGIA
jgi:hypothetical protein